MVRVFILVGVDDDSVELTPAGVSAAAAATSFPAVFVSSSSLVLLLLLS